MLLLWIILIATVATLLLLDLGLLYRRIEQISFIEALTLSGFWIVVSLAFGMLIFFAYEQSWFTSNFKEVTLSGTEAAKQYLVTYLLEKALSLDNLFVISLIFASLNIPVRYQLRVLMFGMLFAILIRLLFIFFGTYLLETVSWIHYGLVILLLFAAIKVLIHPLKDNYNQNNPLVRFVTNHLPVNDTDYAGRFFTRSKTGKGFLITPLFIALLAIESTDLFFAIDSIPASLSISQDTFIVASSNIFALLGLRVLYFVIASAMQQLHYLKVSLIFIYLFCAAKMLLLHTHPLSTDITFLVLSAIIIVGVVASLLQKTHGPVFATSPLATEVGRLYLLTFSSVKRVIILVIGISVIIIGMIMLVTPGPAIIVIPAGLAILATEFVWARTLLRKLRNKLSYYGKETAVLFHRNRKSRKKNQTNKDHS